MSGAIVFLKDFEKRRKEKEVSEKICVDDPEFEKILDELNFTINNGRKQLLRLAQIISEKGKKNDEALMKVFYNQFGVVFKMLKTVF